ncbi:alpha 1,3-glucosidase [Angomonas deanei]|uniref:Glycosyl hydrolases family 31, putative n=1 Tax=Angomonas deanei TaxID=59799 RepID=A0A7G2CR29_9TRYP|nr:alpha 1,3-glucosidase [Angomonas deanei]CAD2222220.1 Glycosyl hydrolases family 31, putative [Angomonas deanei]|eukprot:EPY32179.1 alpha 1,3-glucosidase [Angomonas deanei]
MAYSGASSSGVLFLNTAGMNVKIHDDFVLWEAEVGVTDLFLIPGPTPAEVQRRHAFLTGSTFLPPYFSLGYHQCRWNYLSINDCLAVDEGFDLHSIPYDVLWLDIEHTNKKEYFTWDSDEFADPLLLVEALASKGRKLVTIKDPHIRADPSYNVYREGMAENYFVKSADGVEDYVAKCWPGRSVWADVINNRTRSWYKEFFRSAFSPAPFDNVYTWVDMNEPAVFEGEGSTMHKNAIHYTNDNTTVEHRYVHNVYSFFSALTAYEGMLDTQAPSSERKRPFVLTRSFFAGSQRYAAVWNGDNMARWDHLENTIPELLSLSMSNVPFVGADVGGFLFDTEETLFVRWMQSAVFYPFMRGHAHVETKRREPWTFSPYATEIIRSAIALRYALLPYLYTTFRDAHKNGNIVLRPLVYEFPLSEELREEQHTFMFGPSILVQPIVAKEVKTITTTFPPGVWYAYHTGEALYKQHTMPVELSTMPVYLRGGHIVPMKLRLRRSSHAARFDPFTLFVALDDE